METGIVIAISAMHHAGKDMFSRMLLHQVKSAIIVDSAGDRLPRLQLAVTQMDDLVLSKSLQHFDIIQITHIAGLSSAAGIKGRSIQPDLPAMFRGRGRLHPGSKFPDVAIFVVKLSCLHGDLF